MELKRGPICGATEGTVGQIVKSVDPLSERLKDLEIGRMLRVAIHVRPDAPQLINGNKMQSTELWAIFVKKNPQFENKSTVTMTCSGLRKMFDTTWERGHEQGFKNGKAHAEMNQPPSLFGSIFGGKQHERIID